MRLIRASSGSCGTGALTARVSAGLLQYRTHKDCLLWYNNSCFQLTYACSKVGPTSAVPSSRQRSASPAFKKGHCRNRAHVSPQAANARSVRNGDGATPCCVAASAAQESGLGERTPDGSRGCQELERQNLQGQQREGPCTDLVAATTESLHRVQVSLQSKDADLCSRVNLPHPQLRALFCTDPTSQGQALS